jgi:hypothetical protein
MKGKGSLFILCGLLLAIALAACQPEEVVVTRVVEQEVTRVVTETIIEEGKIIVVTRVVTDLIYVDAPDREEATEEPAGGQIVRVTEAPDEEEAEEEAAEEPTAEPIVIEADVPAEEEAAEAPAEEQMSVEYGPGEILCVTHYLPGRGLLGGDLRLSELGAAELGGAFLHAADFSGATLTTADLAGAELWGAILRDADLGGANLVEADLCAADLSGADLMRANLIDAIYDEQTQWPAGFNYRTVGAIQEEGTETPPQRPGRLPSDALCVIEYDPQEDTLRGAYLDGANLRGAKLSVLPTWSRPT